MPYRIPSPPEEVGGPRGSELVYSPSGDELTRSAARGATQVALAGAMISVAATALGGPTLGIMGLVATVTAAGLRLRVTPPKDGPDAVRFLVEDELVTITQRERVLFCGSIDTITNVELDTKSVTKVRVDNALDVAVQGTSPIRPEVDIARIVLVAASPSTDARRPLCLDDRYVAHMDAVEGLGRIRSFLRAHGWTPEDERDDPSDGA